MANHPMGNLDDLFEMKLAEFLSTVREHVVQDVSAMRSYTDLLRAAGNDPVLFEGGPSGSRMTAKQFYELLDKHTTSISSVMALVSQYADMLTEQDGADES